MYDYLKHKFGHKAASIATGLWLASLLSIILLFGGTPETTIRYLML